MSVGGTSFNIRGSANVELELAGERFTTEFVVVILLTCKNILGLDFLQEQQGTVDLGTKRLFQRSAGRPSRGGQNPGPIEREVLLARAPQ